MTNHITIAQPALVKALAPLARMAPSRATIPVLEHALITAHPDSVELTVNDLDSCLSITLAAETSLAPGAPKSLTLPAQTLSEIVRKLASSAPLTLSWGGDLARVEVKSGHARFQLSSLAAEDFPQFEIGELPVNFTLEASDLNFLLAKTAFAISSDETRYYLSGVYLHIIPADALHLRAVATNGHMLSVAKLPAPFATDDQAQAMPGIIIPAKAVNELMKLLGDYKGPVAISLSAHLFSARLGSTTLTTKLIDGTYPDYIRIIPKGLDKQVTLPRKALHQSVDLVSTVLGAKSNAVKFSFAPNLLELSARDDTNQSTDDLAITYSGPAMEIGFAARYLASIMSILASDTISIEMQDPGSPVLMTEPAETRPDKDYSIILMPMRI